MSLPKFDLMEQSWRLLALGTFWHERECAAIRERNSADKTVARLAHSMVRAAHDNLRDMVKQQC